MVSFIAIPNLDGIDPEISLESFICILCVLVRYELNFCKKQ